MAEATPSWSRIGPLDDRAPIPAGQGTAVTLGPPLARWVLRGDAAVRTAAGSAFGIDLPELACRAAEAEGRAGLWLGPDEWLLLAPPSDARAVAGALATALGAIPHSLVDVAHRQVAIVLDGPAAGDLIATGCPLDLGAAACPVGFASRTLLGKAEVVLWRTSPERFHVEVWRSFATYVWDFLAEAARGVAPPRAAPAAVPRRMPA